MNKSFAPFALAAVILFALVPLGRASAYTL